MAHMVGSMSDDALVSFLRRKARTSLRAVIRYDEDGFEVLHLRDDVESAYEPVEVADAVERHRTAEPVEWRHEAGLRTGAHGATLRVYEEAVVVHIPRGRNRDGAVVSLDIDAAADCVSFVRECVSHLRAEGERVDANDGNTSGRRGDAD